MLFQQFNRLLFLAKGGRTVYFGDLGENSRVLLNYFETAGARKCGDAENPAEYILDVVGAKSTNVPKLDWPEIWDSSLQMKDMRTELSSIRGTSPGLATPDEFSSGQFALPLGPQIVHVTRRVCQQYWRTPGYVMGKLMLATVSALFTGFTFYRPDTSEAGMQNTLFAIFMVPTVFTPLVQQVRTSATRSRLLPLADLE
jgi:hypothetical protein